MICNVFPESSLRNYAVIKTINNNSALYVYIKCHCERSEAIRELHWGTDCFDRLCRSRNDKYLIFVLHGDSGSYYKRLLQEASFSCLLLFIDLSLPEFPSICNRFKYGDNMLSIGIDKKRCNC